MLTAVIEVGTMTVCEIRGRYHTLGLRRRSSLYKGH